LHAGTRFFVRSGRNGTEYTTLVLMQFVLTICCKQNN
jgi:hypothetical protein